MGNDGGSIPKRRELVKNQARAPTHSELKATNLESQTHAWTHDPVTGAHLDLESVVSDWRGRLYNYETILQSLMPSDTDSPDAADAETTHTGAQVFTFASTGIKSLRDIVKLKFTKSGDKEKEKQNVRVCPVSLKEVGPSTKSVYIVPCGHVFAEIAMKQMQEETTCPECSEAFEQKNIVPILPTEESALAKLSGRMDDLKAAGLAHNLKKDKSASKKKRKHDDARGEEKDANGDKKRKATDENGKTSKKDASKTSGINNPLAASLTAKVMAEQEELNKRRKLAARA